MQVFLVVKLLSSFRTQYHRHHDFVKHYGITVSQISTDIESDTESIFVKISLLNNKSLIIGRIYRPPNSDNEYMEKIKCAVDDITKKHRSSVVWLGGDLNLPDISWNSESVIIARHQNPVSLNNKFLELVQDNHLE